MVRSSLAPRLEVNIVSGSRRCVAVVGLGAEHAEGQGVPKGSDTSPFAFFSRCCRGSGCTDELFCQAGGRGREVPPALFCPGGSRCSVMAIYPIILAKPHVNPAPPVSRCEIWGRPLSLNRVPSLLWRGGKELSLAVTFLLSEPGDCRSEGTRVLRVLGLVLA